MLNFGASKPRVGGGPGPRGPPGSAPEYTNGNEAKIISLYSASVSCINILTERKVLVNSY